MSVFLVKKITLYWPNLYLKYKMAKKKKKKWKEENVRSGIWTHALSREPELESGALDHSAILTM